MAQLKANNEKKLYILTFLLLISSYFSIVNCNQAALKSGGLNSGHLERTLALLNPSSGIGLGQSSTPGLKEEALLPSVPKRVRELDEEEYNDPESGLEDDLEDDFEEDTDDGPPEFDENEDFDAQDEEEEEEADDEESDNDDYVLDDPQDRENSTVLAETDFVDDEKSALEALQGPGNKEMETTGDRTNNSETRQFPIYLFQGHYTPEPRLNPFIEGAMRNLARELRQDVMDPVYFRVLPKGRVESRPKPIRKQKSDIDSELSLEETTDSNSDLPPEVESITESPVFSKIPTAQQINSRYKRHTVVSSHSSATNETTTIPRLLDKFKKSIRRAFVSPAQKRKNNAKRRQRIKKQNQNRNRLRNQKLNRIRNQNRKKNGLKKTPGRGRLRFRRKKKPSKKIIIINKNKNKNGIKNNRNKNRFVVIRRPNKNKNNKGNKNKNKNKKKPGKNKNRNKRNKRRTNRNVGGGYVKGLSKLRCDGDAEMQVFGNYTLIRSHMNMGPVDVSMQFRTRRGLRRTSATLPMLKMHTVTRLNLDGSEMIDFLLDRPHPESINVRGNLFPLAKRIARNVFAKLFVPNSFLTSKLREKAALALLSRPKR